MQHDTVVRIDRHVGRLFHEIADLPELLLLSVGVLVQRVGGQKHTAEQRIHREELFLLLRRQLAVQLAQEELKLISGQKPILTVAKKSVANFKLRAGMPIGVKVTLRGERMYEFIERFFNTALPRVRDFRGINPDSFDGRGNYAMGVKEQLIFPEIEYDKIDKVRGMDIMFVTTAKTDEEARELLTLMGAPFAK